MSGPRLVTSGWLWLKQEEMQGLLPPHPTLPAPHLLVKRCHVQTSQLNAPPQSGQVTWQHPAPLSISEFKDLFSTLFCSPSL